MSNKGDPYEYQSAHQLLTDFFVDVDAFLSEIDK